MKDKNIDYTPSLFPDLYSGTSLPVVDNKQKEQWAFKKSQNFGMEFCSSALFCGQYGIPLIRKYTEDWPERFITLSEMKSVGTKNIGVATFDYDCVLEHLVSKPSAYIEQLSTYKCVCEPDLSINVREPLAIAVGNTFRSHAISYYLQQNNCHVIYTVKWSTPNTYDVCFSGYEKGGAVIVSTIGVTRDERSRMYFSRGFTEMLKRISPDSVGLYGDRQEWIDNLIPSQLDVHYFSHERFNRMRGYGK
jgi:hypothetical protein